MKSSFELARYKNPVLDFLNLSRPLKRGSIYKVIAAAVEIGGFFAVMGYAETEDFMQEEGHAGDDFFLLTGLGVK